MPVELIPHGRQLIHLHPTAPMATRVLLPGDPGRALRLANLLIEAPKMFNHHRGLWGYTGPARHDGEPLTIQSTGMGGPSAAIVVSELVGLGATTLLRVGTTGGLDPALGLGELVVVTEAIADDGTSRALTGGIERLAPDPRLTDALLGGGARPVAGGAPQGTTGATVVSTDLFYDAEDRQAGWRAAGARAVEMECAALFALAARHGVAAGAALIVSDRLGETHERIDAEALEAAERALGELAVAGLARV